VSRNIRIAAPALYAAALVVGFLISSKVGIVVAIGGAMLLGLVFSLGRGGAGAGPTGGRNRNRNRNRDRS
jgi:hypothetical protein